MLWCRDAEMQIHLRSIISMVLRNSAPTLESHCHNPPAAWVKQPSDYPGVSRYFRQSFNPAGQRDFPGQATWYGWVPLGLESAVCSLEVCYGDPSKSWECFWEEREVRLQRERATPLAGHCCWT